MSISAKKALFIASCLGVLAAAGCSGGGGSSALVPFQGPTPIPTPTAPAAPTPTPAPLAWEATLGTATFPNGDTAQGGQGAPVDGIPCVATPPTTVHIHPHVSLFVNGNQVAIPLAIGIMNPHISPRNEVDAASCYYYLHTHQASGIIHVEAASASPAMTLGQLFDIWGQPLSSSNIAGNSGPTLFYIDATPYNGDPRLIALDVDRKQITLEVGLPFVYPQFYSY